MKQTLKLAARAASELLVDVLGIGGAVLISRGAWIANEALGYVAAGGFLLAAAVILAKR